MYIHCVGQLAQKSRLPTPFPIPFKQFNAQHNFQACYTKSLSENSHLRVCADSGANRPAESNVQPCIADFLWSYTCYSTLWRFSSSDATAHGDGQSLQRKRILAILVTRLISFLEHNMPSFVLQQSQLITAKRLGKKPVPRRAHM